MCGEFCVVFKDEVILICRIIISNATKRNLFVHVHELLSCQRFLQLCQIPRLYKGALLSSHLHWPPSCCRRDFAIFVIVCISGHISRRMTCEGKKQKRRERGPGKEKEIVSAFQIEKDCSKRQQTNIWT